MPTKRPDGDALAIWLIVQVRCDGQRGRQDSAFLEISQSLKPLPKKRGRTPLIDHVTGLIFGDKLAIESVEALFKRAQTRRAIDPKFERETSSRLAYFKAEVAAKPGSRLLPFRNKASDSKVCEWMIAQYWPGVPLEQRLTMHTPHEPPPGYAIRVGEADDPDGLIEYEWLEVK
jgi:hypothetical protein